jgi:probable blue pigment (indigoidine) exporter
VNFKLNPILTGFLFALFWGSAAVAGKYGLLSVEPLVLFSIRFLGAGTLLLIYAYIFQRSEIPSLEEFKQVTIFGILNTTLYLGLFALALKSMTPGITTLAVATNPLFISVFTALSQKRKVLAREWISITIGIIGIIIACYPLLMNSYASVEGMILIGLSQISYSIGAVYYSSVSWKLPRITINGWQVFIGGILLLPFTFLLHQEENHFDSTFFISLAWLIFPVSILAVQLWLRLLKADAVRASLWLFLCPVFGFIFASLLFDEPITFYTVIGTLMVMAALYLGQQKAKN